MTEDGGGRREEDDRGRRTENGERRGEGERKGETKEEVNGRGGDEDEVVVGGYSITCV